MNISICTYDVFNIIIITKYEKIFIYYVINMNLILFHTKIIIYFVTRQFDSLSFSSESECFAK